MSYLTLDSKLHIQPFNPLKCQLNVDQ